MVASSLAILRSASIHCEAQKGLFVPDLPTERIKTVKIRPANGVPQLTFFDQAPRPQDTTPITYENTLKYWEVLHKIINDDVPYEGYRNYCGELAALAIVKGQPFAPDARMKGILEKAARAANAHMRVQSFAER